jgi:hypothetical protein
MLSFKSCSEAEGSKAPGHVRKQPGLGQDGSFLPSQPKQSWEAHGPSTPLSGLVEQAACVALPGLGAPRACLRREAVGGRAPWDP